ncbi:MAG: restriction endonuclease subunit S [Magnetococcales bacterium]|nr:restriction endonuclease subunit S [Magnetococcales bacterium]
MTPKTFLENFGHLSGTPGAVKRLRALILQLAVQGKLVPQDPNDEPASVLLKKIAAEKARLVREGKIRAPAPLPPIKLKEVPFELPEGWEWSKMGTLSIVERGGSPRPINDYLTDDPNGLNWIKIGDTEMGGKFIVSAKERIRNDGLKKTRMVYPGDFLLTNSMSFGRPYITLIEGCIHDGWLRIHPPSELDKDYLYITLSSSYVVDQFKDSAAGGVVQNLNSEKVRHVIISLPPLAEQHRIVARVDQLMALCDQLEKQEAQTKETHQALTQSTLHALTTADGPHAFQTAWHRIRDHFDPLFITLESVTQLRQTILQLAVMGKLVPQDPNDEPASVLLKKIAAEKAKLVREGKIKRGETLPPVDPEDAPFELPRGWEWCRLGMLGNVKGGGTPSKQRPEYWEGDIPWISPKDMKVDFILDSIDHINDAAVDDSSVKMIEKGALLMVVRGMILDHSFPTAITIVDATINQDMKALELFIDSMQRFVLLVSKGSRDRFLALVQRSSHGTCRIESDRLFSFIIPLPPIAEQHRIVARVDQLMALLDRLEKQLKQSQAEGARLMEAVVHHLSAA